MNSKPSKSDFSGSMSFGASLASFNLEPSLYFVFGGGSQTDEREIMAMLQANQLAADANQIAAQGVTEQRRANEINTAYYVEQIKLAREHVLQVDRDLLIKEETYFDTLLEAVFYSDDKARGARKLVRLQTSNRQLVAILMYFQDSFFNTTSLTKAYMLVLLLNASDAEKEALVQVFVEQCLLAETSNIGAFDQAVHEWRAAHEQTLEQSRKQAAIEASPLFIEPNWRLRPEALLTIEELQSKLERGGCVELQEWHPILCTVWHYAAAGQIEMGLYSKEHLGLLASRVLVNISWMISNARELALIRMMAKEEKLDAATCTMSSAEEVLRGSRAVQELTKTLRDCYCWAAWCIMHAQEVGLNDEIFSRNKKEMVGQELIHRFACHIAPDFVAFVDALLPFYSKS